MVRSLVYLALAVGLNAISSVFYKFSSMNAVNRILSAALLTTGLVVGAVNATLYTKCLGSIRLNVAYPVFSAGSMMGVTVLSSLVFHEAVTPLKMVGIGVLVAGVILVSV